MELKHVGTVADDSNMSLFKSHQIGIETKAKETSISTVENFKSHQIGIETALAPRRLRRKFCL